MISIKDAIDKNDQSVDALHIGFDDLEYCTQENIEKLPRLKKVSLHVTGENNAWTAYPEALLLDSIEELDIHGVRIPDFAELNLKKLTAIIHSIDFPAIANNFPELEELTLVVEGAIVIDEAFARLSRLKKLTLKCKKNSEISFAVDDLSKMSSMEVLELRNAHDSVFAKQWCTLETLKELSLSRFEALTEFPQEMTRFKVLESLCLTHVGTRNKGWDEDDFFDDDESIDMPEGIALLESLSVFKSNFCAYGNFEPLADLKKLMEISIESAQITKIPDLSALEKLEILNIPESYEVTSIAGVKGAKKLKSLNIRSSKVKNLDEISSLKCLQSINIQSTPVDKNKYTVVSALMSLDSYPVLKEVEAENLSLEEWMALDKEQYLEKLNKQEILSICKKPEEAGSEKFERACRSIFDLKDVFEGEIEEEADSGGRDTISFFDKALNQHVSAFKDETLVHLIEISFADTSLMDSYELTVIVLEEAIRRKSVIVQDAMAKAFIKCQCYYDSGHRFFGSTVYDTLVDELFSMLEQAPLARVLLETDEQLLYSSQHYGDDVGNSFYSYFKKATDRNMALKVLAKYKDFIFEEISRTEDEDDIDAIFENLKEAGDDAVIEEEIADLAGVLSLYSKAYLSKRMLNTEIFIRELCLDKNNEYLMRIDWENLFEFEGELKKISKFNKINFDICYEIFMKYVGLYKDDKEDESKLEAFFTLLYVLDKEKLRSGVVRDIRQASVIEETGYDSIFNVDKKNINLYRTLLVGEINGEDIEVIKSREIEKEALEEKERAEEKVKKELESNIEEAFDEAMAMDDEDDIDKFIEISSACAREMADPESIAYEFSLYTAKLIIQCLQHGEFLSAEKIFDNFVDNLLPYAGMHEKTSDVSSNALVLGIHAKNQEVCDKVFNLLPGGHDFDVTEINNEILLFNLSCYYAIHEDKKRLLPVVGQALKQGKTVNEFMQDEDFSRYHEDKDFLAVLEQ